MAGVDDIATALQAAIDELNDAIGAANNAESEAGDTVSQMAALGVQDKVQEFTAVKEAIEKARTHLAGGSDLLDEAMNLVRAASG